MCFITPTPEDVRFAHPQHKDMPNFRHIVDGTGYYCLYSGHPQKSPVFFNLSVGQFQIVINLETEKALIRRNNTTLGHNEPYVEWQLCDEEAIPMDRNEMKSQMDTFG